MLKTMREILWPTLERADDDEIRRLMEYEAVEIEKITLAEFKVETSAALTIASKIYESEDERGRSAETKSFYLLLVAAALVPLLTYLESAIWEGKFGTAPKWLSLSILIVAVLYLVSAAYWALKAVSVRIYHTVGPSDLASIWLADSPLQKLVKETLVSTLRNQTGTNEKVSAVKMGTAFLLRAIWTFGLLILVQAGWEISVLIGPYLSGLICV